MCVLVVTIELKSSSMAILNWYYNLITCDRCKAKEKPAKEECKHRKSTGNYWWYVKHVLVHGGCTVSHILHAEFKKANFRYMCFLENEHLFYVGVATGIHPEVSFSMSSPLALDYSSWVQGGLEVKLKGILWTDFWSILDLVWSSSHVIEYST